MATIDDGKLIEEIREHEVLYNIRLKKYKDLNAKESAWKKIAEAMGKSGEHAKMAFIYFLHMKIINVFPKFPYSS